MIFIMNVAVFIYLPLSVTFTEYHYNTIYSLGEF